jgi:hypothetical protein
MDYKKNQILLEEIIKSNTLEDKLKENNLLKKMI